jgi:hypothetical protein
VRDQLACHDLKMMGIDFDLPETLEARISACSLNIEETLNIRFQPTNALKQNRRH